MKILIIEDNAYKCEDIVKCLQGNYPQAEIDTAASYSKGVRKGYSGNYDIIIIDNCLPFYDNNPYDLHPDMAELIMEELDEMSGDTAGKFIICSQYENEEEGEHLCRVQKRRSSVCLGVVRYQCDHDDWKEKIISLINNSIDNG